MPTNKRLGWQKFKNIYIGIHVCVNVCYRMLLHKNEFKLKKGTGFHLDQFLLGIVTMLCGMFGLPYMCPATVRSVAHVSALAVMSRTHAPGEKPKLLEVKDQRVTNIVMNILIGMYVGSAIIFFRKLWELWQLLNIGVNLFQNPRHSWLCTTGRLFQVEMVWHSRVD